MSCNKDKKAKVLKTIGPILAPGQLSGEARPRIEVASFNNDNGVLTLTRDDNTFINVVLQNSSNYISLKPNGTLVTQDVGGIDAGTDVANLTGLPISIILDRIFFPPVMSTLVLTGSSPNPGYVEVGDTISPLLSTLYTPNDAGAVISFSLEKNSVEITTVQTPYTDNNLTSATPATFTYQSSVVYAADVLPIGSLNSNTQTYNFIYPYFWGVSNDNTIDAADIAAGNKVVGSSTSPTITFGSTPSQYIWIAVPATTSNYDEWYINALNNGDIGSPSDLFDDPTTVSVTSTGWAGIDYKLYVSSYSTEVTEPMTLS